jgi:CobQ/CobB/MinD/ParA nucleotide binding domain
MPILTISATKGGQGVTTIAAALATLTAHTGARTLLIDTGGDLAAILGRTEHHGPGLADYLANPNVTLADITIPISDQLEFIARGTGPIVFSAYTYGLITGGLGHYDVVIIDCALTNTEWPALADQRVHVTRNCYLAVRNAIRIPKPTHVVAITEPGRSLSPADIETVLGMPVTATITADIETARIIDAGILTTRLPRTVARALAPIVTAATAGIVEVAR